MLSNEMLLVYATTPDFFPNPKGWSVGANNSQFIFKMRGDASQQKNAVHNGWNKSNWHHVVCTYDADGGSGGGKLWMYVDGAQVGADWTFTDTITYAGTERLWIMRGTSLQPWQGGVDELTVWASLLSLADAQELYNGGSGLSYPWPFSQEYSITVETDILFDDAVSELEVVDPGVFADLEDDLNYVDGTTLVRIERQQTGDLNPLAGTYEKGDTLVQTAYAVKSQVTERDLQQSNTFWTAVDTKFRIAAVNLGFDPKPGDSLVDTAANAKYEILGTNLQVGTTQVMLWCRRV
jgi:hypothetical protein